MSLTELDNWGEAGRCCPKQRYVSLLKTKVHSRHVRGNIFPGYFCQDSCIVKDRETPQNWAREKQNAKHSLSKLLKCTPQEKLGQKLLSGSPLTGERFANANRGVAFCFTPDMFKDIGFSLAFMGKLLQDHLHHCWFLHFQTVCTAI